MIQETSLDAFFDIKDSLPNSQRKVWSTLLDCVTPLTNLEVSKRSGIPINQVTPRMNELVKKGIVVQHSKRNCTVSGRIAITWKIKEK